MIKLIVKKLFPKTLKELIADETFVALNKAEKERNEERFKINLFELEQMKKNGAVILMCNEWENPMVGDIVSIEVANELGYSFMLGIYDYLTKEVRYTTNKPLPFTMQKLKAVDKLNPDDICALFYEGKYLNKEVYKKQYSEYREKNIVRTNFSDWVERLEKNGFFKKYTNIKA